MGAKTSCPQCQVCNTTNDKESETINDDSSGFHFFEWHNNSGPNEGISGYTLFGYILFGLAVVALIAICLCAKRRISHCKRKRHLRRGSRNDLRHEHVEPRQRERRLPCDASARLHVPQLDSSMEAGSRITIFGDTNDADSVSRMNTSNSG